MKLIAPEAQMNLGSIAAASHEVYRGCSLPWQLFSFTIVFAARLRGPSMGHPRGARIPGVAHKDYCDTLGIQDTICRWRCRGRKRFERAVGLVPPAPCAAEPSTRAARHSLRPGKRVLTNLKPDQMAIHRCRKAHSHLLATLDIDLSSKSQFNQRREQWPMSEGQSLC